MLGTFRWQTQPYCNVLTLFVVQQGAGYSLTGADDMCGGGAAAPATGTAVVNPNGTIAMGVSVVTPTGATAQIAATLNPATVSGSWTDADGHSGAFAFNPSAITGVPRPAPTTSSLVTSAQLAASIFAGTGGATTVARSDHQHDDRYYTKSETDVVVAAAGATVVHGPGFNMPNPLLVERTMTNLGESFVTPEARGRGC